MELVASLKAIVAAETPLVEVGVMAPREKEKFPEVVIGPPVAETPFAVVTPTEVTVPDPPLPAIAPHVPLWQEYCVPVVMTCWFGNPDVQAPDGAEETETILGFVTCALRKGERKSRRSGL